MKFSMIFEAQVELGTPDVERAAIRSCIDQASKRCRCAASTRRRRSRRCGTRASRFFAEAITHWAAPKGVPRARGTDRVDQQLETIRPWGEQVIPVFRS